ncbi:MAG: sensor domain-containing diguanylate cyclase [Bdellovibrionota bacterium]
MEQDLQKLHQKISQLQAILEMVRAMTSALDGTELYRTLLKKITDLLHPSSWALLLLDEQDRHLYYEIVINDTSLNRDQIFQLGEGIPGWVAKEQKAVFYSPNSYCPLPKELVKGERKSFLCAPLISKGSLRGVVQLNRMANETPFEQNDLEQLVELTDFIAIGIENYKYVQKIEELTIKDDLTQLYNSRQLHQILDREIDLSKRYKREFSVIFFDLDHFKKVNDAHGHVFGSALLSEVGGIVNSNMRSTDYAARYGGDEFVIVLPETTKEMAMEFAERLRNVIEKHSFLKNMGKDIHFTASFGVATFPTNAQSKDEIIQMADNAMYDAKKKSRNRVMSID